MSKGSHSDETFYLKPEIALNIEHFTHLFSNRRTEQIDLNHNNQSSIYYRCKTTFEYMVVYDLVIDDFTYTVKFGKLKEIDTLSLYSITG